MGIEQKAWGTVRHVVVNSKLAISHLNIRAGTRCSKHYHNYRFNAFYVLEGGPLVVEEWASLSEYYRKDNISIVGQPAKSHILLAGHSIVIPIRTVHRFRALDECEVIEVYYPISMGAVKLDDIHRFDEGGEDDQTELRKKLGL